MRLQQFDEGIWTYESKLKLTRGILPFVPPKILGQPSIRMCIVQKENGGLILYSPVNMDEEVVDEIKRLGPVDLILGSNIFHNTYLVKSHQIFQPARCLVAPKTVRRNSEVKDFKVWDDLLDLESKRLSSVIMKGNVMNEIFLYHQPSKTLILTDFLTDMSHGGNFFERMYSLYAGVYKEVGVPSYQRKNIRDKEAFLRSIDQVMDLDFEKVILAHGRCVLSNGKKIFSAAWEKILRQV